MSLVPLIQSWEEAKRKAEETLAAVNAYFSSEEAKRLRQENETAQAEANRLRKAIKDMVG